MTPALPRPSLADRFRSLAGRQAGEKGARSAFDHLMRNQAAAAVAISGADKSAWTGYVQATSGGALGTANFHGVIDYDQAQVLDPLHELSRNNGRQQDRETLLRYRNALQTMLHENSHMLGPRDSDWAQSTGPYQVPSNMALEEGVTEAWSVAHVNNYIDALGAEKLAPGIKGTVTRQPYPQYVPAAQVLAYGIGQDIRQSGDEVLRRLNTHDVGGKWPAAADMMFRSTDLPSIVPPEHHDIVRGRIQHAMQSNFSHLRDLQGTPDQLRLASVAAGQTALAAGRAEIKAMQQHYRPVLQQNPELSRQQGQHRTQPLDPDRTQPLGGPRVQPIDQQSTQPLGQRPARPDGERTGTGNQQPIDPRTAWAAGLAPLPGPEYGQRRTDQQTGRGVVPHGGPGGADAAAGQQADPRAGLLAELRQVAAAANSGTAPPTAGRSGQAATQTATSSGTPPRSATVHRLPDRAGGSERDR